MLQSETTAPALRFHRPLAHDVLPRPLVGLELKFLVTCSITSREINRKGASMPDVTTESLCLAL